VVDGALGAGHHCVGRDPLPCPPDTEARVADFADLRRDTIANAEAREQLK